VLKPLKCIAIHLTAKAVSVLAINSIKRYDTKELFEKIKKNREKLL